MLSIVNEGAIQQSPEVGEPEAAAEFEIVLGKRQIAGVLFLATVFIAVFSAVSYIAGEAIGPRRTVVVERPVPVAVAPAQAVAPPAKTAPAPLPLFGDPTTGALYLQLGAVDKGTATIMVEGLRVHGFAAFAANGPNTNLFRVLAGPFDDEDAFHRAKKEMDDLGLVAFGKRFQ